MDMFDVASDALAKSYDDVPYESRPFSQTLPARSSALARLFGLTPPDVATARVLELGCAAGGNLIPMAAAFPDATFTGVDLSAFQVGEGQARIASLGLGNVRLRHQSIADIGADDGTFDYIICHGVFSWVPEPVRDAILRVCSENLSDTGIAYISYNVHPGWRLRGVLREAMLFHIQGIENPGDKVRESRTLLAQLAEISDGASAYGLLLRQEARALATHSDYYILHEHLEQFNEPCYVADFLTRARAAGLTFLTEANLNTTIAESFGPQAAPILRTLSGNRLERMEQYIDFMTGRTFRQSLLVKSTQEPRIVRTLEPRCLDGLQALASVQLGETGGKGAHVLRDAAGRTLTTALDSVRDGILALAQDYPRSLGVDQVAATPAQKTSADDAAHLKDALFKMVLVGMAEVRTVAVEAAFTIAEKPVASALARADAAAGRSWTTNACHESITLNVVQQALLPLLDGTNDHAVLATVLAERAACGLLAFQRDGATLTEAPDVAQAARDHVASALDSLRRSALLVAA